MRSCPHCGASLHEEASFCPYCTQAINTREEIHPPRHMPRRALYSALLVFRPCLKNRYCTNDKEV